MRNYGNQSLAMFVGRMGPIVLQGTKIYIQRLYERGLTIIDENLHTSSEHTLTKPGSLINELLNNFILQFQQHGFFQHLYQKHLHMPIVNLKDPRKILTMYMLSSGFYLWLMSVAVACIVFVIEHIVRYFSRTRHLTSESEVTIFYDELVYDVERSKCERHSENIEIIDVIDD